LYSTQMQAIFKDWKKSGYLSTNAYHLAAGYYNYTTLQCWIRYYLMLIIVLLCIVNCDTILCYSIQYIVLHCISLYC